VPGGQGVGRVEFDGQKLPGRHKMGMPEKQKKEGGQTNRAAQSPVGQTVQTARRTRLFELSPINNAPSEAAEMPNGE
jgi:hypothetical protein